MKEKKTRRWLSLLLTVVMVLSLLPAAVVPAAAANETDDFYKIVHLDCGRKYFSPSNIKKIIDNAAAAGFNQVELYLSDNQGFRFALDDKDMVITTSSGKTYDLSTALGDGYSYDGKTPDGSGKYLTQSEMDDIINYAKGKKIDIVPCINVPGHMGTILEKFSDFRYKSGTTTSRSSIDLENEEAVAFALAITEKYAAYFQSQGVKYYNLGADEYANDVGSMGFSGLYNTNKYGKFVDFLNKAAKIVISHDMTPRVFNDGLYYHNQNNYPLDEAVADKLEVCYWSCGWNGYDLASARYLVNQGLKVINTHGGYYWVLGNSSWQCSADKAKGFDYTNFQYMDYTPGSSKIDNPAGAMFCIWCDVGNADGTDDGDKVVEDTADVIAAFGAALPVSDNGSNSGGDNGDNGNNGSNGGNTGTLEERTITVAEGATYTDTIEGYNYADKSYETENPSIATVEVTGTTVDAKKTLTEVTDANFIFDADKQYLIVNNSSNKLLDTKDTDSENGGAGKATGLVLSTFSEDTSADSTKTWTITANGTSGYTVKNSAGKYLTIENIKSSSSTSPSNITLDYNGETWTISSNGYYLNNYAGSGKIAAGWNGSGASTDSGSQWKIYEVNSTGGTASTKVVFKGLKANEMTTVTIGHVTYTIHVVDAALADTKQTVEYWITNAKVTANGATSGTITAADGTVNSAGGAKISELVPAQGTHDNHTTVFWKGTRFASNNKQTMDKGDDKTQKGTDFAYIRYWDNKWSYSADGKTWRDVQSGDQIVAYYLQRTTVTDEVISDVVDYGPEKKDWGDLTTLGGNYVLLDYSVKYASGTETPYKFPSDKSIGFHCNMNTDLNKTVFTDDNDNYYRRLGGIRAVETSDYEVYMITVTPTSNSTSDVLASTAAGNTSYAYNGTETVAWAATQEDLDASGLGTYKSISGAFGCTIGGEPTVSGLEIYSQHGMKVTYYVRAKVSADELYVHYVNQADDKPFYEYTINVKGNTTFKEGIGLNDPWKQELKDGDVLNTLNKTEYVTADLSKMLAVAPAYRYSDYECVKVVRSNDGKDVYLYYKFNNTHNIVIDFGLPVNIQPTDIDIDAGDWTGAKVTEKSEFGTATIGVGEGLTYTPTKVLTDHDTLNLTLIDADNKESNQQIYIYPASNVLYEDNFLTVNTEKGQDYAAWEHKDGTYSKQSADQKTLYGYDKDAYGESVGNSMGSAWTITGLEKGKGSKYLTTTFNGTGFDLIGTAGPNTGYVYLVLQGPENRVVVIDTSYGEGTLHQVPLAHLDGLKAGTYTVNIRAAYRAAPVTSTAAGTNSIAAYSLQNAKADALNDVYEEVESMLPAGMDLDDCEFVYADSESPLAELDNSSVAAYALTADEVSTAAAVTRTVGTTVTIDGFRVYRDANNPAYTESEQGVQYVNVLDKVNKEFIAYVEGSDGNTWTKDTYEANGGPQNEVYLGNGTDAIAFKVGNAGTKVQISARAVSGPAQLVVNNKVVQQLTSNTEMYYEVTADNDGIITIKNGETGMLALGNLKLPADTSTQALTAADEEIVLSLLSMDPAPAFAPKLSAAARSFKVIRNKLVTVTVHASTDVARLTINGKTVSPTNGLLVKRGWSKEYIYLFTDTVKRDASKTYEIIAYNADGTAGAPVQVTG